MHERLTAEASPTSKIKDWIRRMLVSWQIIKHWTMGCVISAS